MVPDEPDGSDDCDGCREARDGARQRKARRFAWMAFGSVILFFAVWFSAAAAWGATGQYEFIAKVGGHLGNAQSSDTPELIKASLLKAKVNMTALGFTRGDYAAYFYWDRTPSRSLAFWYDRIDAFVQRCDEVIVWRDVNLQNHSIAEINDAYQTKITNVKSSYNAAESDLYFVAQQAFTIRYYFGWYFAWIPFIIHGALTAVAGVYAAIRRFDYRSTHWRSFTRDELAKMFPSVKCADHRKPKPGKAAEGEGGTP